jgi:acetyl-CoA C-acetyltransferase
MRCESVAIPVGGAWSSPFARWQGPLKDDSSLDVAVAVTRAALAERAFDPARLTGFVLGMTVPQLGAFYAPSTVATGIGAPQISGPLVVQACATSVKALQSAAAETEGAGGTSLVVLTDRTSNGPHVIYPGDSGIGGRVAREDIPLDAFAADPLTGLSMLETAEAVAEEAGFSRSELDELTALRYAQYESSLADDRAFQRRYMVPVELERRRGPALRVEEDHGVRSTTLADLTRLAPTRPDGTLTGGTQTHPADGAAGMLVTDPATAKELGRDGAVARVLAFGNARAEAARMPKAPVPAALQALERAGLGAGQVDLVVTHNPFAVNDLWLARELGFDQEQVNPKGCSLVYGHPQGPTGARGIAELIEALADRGGGTGLFTGCAAGDTGAAVLLRVEG